MNIRYATQNDIDSIMTVYDKARAFMRAQGNSQQWINGYPQRSLVADDIKKRNCYVCVGDDGAIHGVFAFIIGDDPTYRVIRDGAWLNDEPYGTIHRIGSDGTERGIFTACLAYCRTKVKNIRADTHAVNYNMQDALTRHGFKKCGIITIEDGSDRTAFQLVC